MGSTETTWLAAIVLAVTCEGVALFLGATACERLWRGDRRGWWIMGLAVLLLGAGIAVNPSGPPW